MSLRDLHGPRELGMLHLADPIQAARLRGRHEERAIWLAEVTRLIAQNTDANAPRPTVDSLRKALAMMSIAATTRHAEDASGVPLGEKWPVDEGAEPVILKLPTK